MHLGLWLLPNVEGDSFQILRTDHKATGPSQGNATIPVTAGFQAALVLIKAVLMMDQRRQFQDLGKQSMGQTASIAPKL
jgi:hypothetical protein